MSLRQSSPLSHGQQALWFIYQETPENTAYNMALPLQFSREIDPPSLRRAVQQLLECYPALRTRFGELDGVPYQQVTHESSHYWREVDATGWTESELTARLQQASQQPFVLEEGGFRATLFRKNVFQKRQIQGSEIATTLLLTLHHIVGDAHSLAILGQQLLQHLTLQTPVAPANHYGDYVHWEKQLLASAKGQRMAAYWEKLLAGEVPVLQLPTDFPRPPVQTFNGASLVTALSVELTQKLKALAKAQKSTLFTVLLSAWQVLLHRYCGQSDIWIAVPTATARNQVKFADMVGYLVNPMIVRTHFPENNVAKGKAAEGNMAQDKSLTFNQLVLQTGRQMLSGLYHQPYPFTLLIKQLQPQRDPSYPPLVQVMFTLETSDLIPKRFSADCSISGESYRAQRRDIAQMQGQFDMSLTWLEGVDEQPLSAVFSYNRDLFEAATIARMAEHLQVLLDAAASNAEQSIHQLALLTESEKAQLTQWQKTKIDYPNNKTVVDCFEQQAEKTPDNIALVFESQSLTYRQLNEKANQLARHLLTRLHQGGISEVNPLIAISVERSVEAVIGLLAIIKAGAVYVPIDPSYPAARIRHMLEDSAVSVFLTQSHLKAQLPLDVLPLKKNNDCIVFCLDETDVTEHSAQDLELKPRGTDLAYVIYTSGSTGIPKGVMIEHHALVQHILSILQQYRINETDNVLQFASLSFDASLEQIFVAWLAGARSVWVKTNIMTAPNLLSFLHTQAITVANFPPAYWQQILDIKTTNCTLFNDSLFNLKTLILGGEALPVSLAQQTTNALPAVNCFNAYGPTETVITATLYRLPKRLPDNAISVAIGRPCANTRIYILNTQHHLQPLGIAGELCIAGTGLARGYLNRPELTAEKFVELNVLGNIERIYKTGDLARWLPDTTGGPGNLEYLGRIDSQVKLRGFRIELAEIESVLSQYDTVKESVVNLYEADGNQRLVAYLTTHRYGDCDIKTIDVNTIKDWLKTRLPDYMIPSQFMVLGQLPLAANGKIDRRALPAPVMDAVTDAPQLVTQTEELLANLWAGILKRETIYRQDNFFELGGHSLLATQLVARIRDVFQTEMSVRTVFDTPVLSQLAAHIDTSTRKIARPAIVKQPVDSPKVLSFAQQRLWFLNQMEENNSATYNIPMALLLTGALDVDALQQSLSWLIQRHESLRSVFPAIRGSACVQILEEHIDILQVHDWRHLSTHVQQKDVQHFANCHAIEPFDLAAGPLLKADLLLLGNELSDKQHSVLLLNIHHIISDAWSMGVFVRDWQHAYNAFAKNEQPSLSPLRIQYSDYSVWQRDWLQGEVLQQQVEYWREQLAGAPPLLDLPTDKPRPPKQRYQGARLTHTLPRALSNSISMLSQQHGASVFMTLLSAFYIFMSRYSRQDDICVGSPIANRTHSQTEDLIGFMVNTQVLRGRLRPEQRFIELLQATRQNCLAAYAHQDIPFEMLVEQLQPTRSLSHAPLFQVMLVQQTESIEISLPGVEVSTLEPDYPISKFDLTLYVQERDEQLHCMWEYATDLFHADTIKRMAGNFEILLSAIAENPLQSISRLPLLTDRETQQLQAWNDTQAEFRVDKTIVEWFEQQVEKTPNNIAVVFESKSLTYRQLNEKSNQLAHHLLTHLHQAGIHEKNPLIAIAVARSLDMVIGLLGILKAGGAYVPIDPVYPTERIRYMLEDSAAPVLVTQSDLNILPQEQKDQCILIYLDGTHFSEQSLANENKKLNPTITRQMTDLAYVIYTSGSTGRPKGVSLPQAALVNLLLWQSEQVGLEQPETTLQFTTLSFDVSFQEIFSTLLSGGKLVLIDEQTRRDVTALTAYLSAYHIERLFLPYVMLQHIAQQGGIAQFESLSLKNIITAGEQLRITPEIKTLFKCLPDCRLHNHYGPTESHVVTAHALPQASQKWVELPPIGQAIANTRIYILSPESEPQPVGVAGELCIAGIGLACGYLNSFELTAEKFVNVELFGKRERIYKTGDLARWLPDGHLDYLGRLDAQVKLRGFRIELSEIETALSQHETVSDAVVILYTADDNKRLVAYFTTDCVTCDVQSIDLQSIKDELKARLPDYMIPRQFMALDKLPLTPNGKVDRLALPEPEMEAATGAVLPITPTEQLLSSLWAGILKRDTIYREDNFFELGGHSLLATQLVARIRDSFQAELAVRAVFESPQLFELALAIDAALGTVSLPAIEPQAVDANKVLSFAQQRLWFLNEFEGNASATYNMPVAVQLSGHLDEQALQQSLHWLIERHQCLRSCFPTKDGQAHVQLITLTQPLSTHDLRHLSASEQQAQVQHHIKRHAIEPFDLTRGPLFKAELLQLAQQPVDKQTLNKQQSNKQQWVLLLNMHHIVSDGWSMAVLTRDLHHAYSAFSQNTQPTKPALAIQYSDYALWQHEWLQGEVLQQQRDYWQQQLSGIPELLDLPTDNPRPAQQNFQGAHFTYALSPALSQGLTGLSRELGASVFMTLLSTYYILLARYSRQDDICVGSPIANRTHSQSEDLIGFFVNTVVLRAQLQPQQSFIELLQETRKTCLAAYAHQDIPFEMLVEQLQPARSLSHSPLFQVMLVLHPQDQQFFLTLPGLQSKTLTPDYPVSKFNLTLHVEEHDEQLRCVWEYATDLFHVDTIERMARHFDVLLTAIVNNPTQAIGQLPMLMDSDIQQLQTWNDTATDAPLDNSIVDLFELQVAKTPNNIALVFEGEQLTYQQLNEQSNQLAHHLLARQESPRIAANPRWVAIVLERSFEMIIGLLGILKAGGTYVPIDPSYPAARIKYLLEDSGASLLLTHSRLLTGKAPLPITSLEHDSTVLCLDEVIGSSALMAAGAVNTQALENPQVNRRNTDLAYVIYTSGSTGKPKGVMVEHGGLCNLTLALIRVLHVDETSRQLQFASLSFDASMIEIATSLLTGGSLYLVSKTQLLETASLTKLLLQQNITHATLPPTFLNNLPALALSSLNTLVVAGEACPQKLIKQWANRVRFLNAYGPTECTVAASVAMDFSETDCPHIGRPLANTRIYILDAQHQLQPPGVPGELCIAGSGVARGYHNRPALTAEKFIDVDLSYGATFSKTERIYKTGDLARWLPDGNLEYLGRIDQQIKLRGFRIELGEIESVLMQQPVVKDAAVTLDGADENKYLIAYVTTDSGVSFDILRTQLKAWLSARLPEYMIPSHFMVLDKLALTTNGKIDRNALPVPNLAGKNDEHFVQAQTMLERQIAEIWQDVLKLEKIAVHDNFFDLGGSSLLLMQVQSRLQTLLEESLSVVTLFQYPTVHSLAIHLGQSDGVSSVNPIKVPTAMDTDDIAIIGMAGRFPGANDIDVFWENLRNGVESIAFFSDEELLENGIDPTLLKQPNFVKAGAVLDGVELFDARFFGYTPREADCLDPQLRLFLETTWVSLEHAGYNVGEIDFPVGVFAGADAGTYIAANILPNKASVQLPSEFQLFLGDRDFIAASTAYKLNLTGPALFIFTACSTSLVAVHNACENLLNNKCDIALAGAASVSLPQKRGYLYQKGMIFSPDGHCRAFDAEAQGAVGGSGVGVVTLKRLSRALADGDTIHAVIKGSAINNDGTDKVGFSAPSVTGQAKVIAQAMQGLDYESISYVETHGTATELGDPIEVAALTQAYQTHTQKTGYCAIGSVKTNVGHLNSAAGVTSLIKTVLALKHREIPPSLHFQRPNAQIDFANSPFFVNGKLTPWQSCAPRRAGVSSFGMGGTNAHVVLEEAPKQVSAISTHSQLLCLSAKSEQALYRACDNLADHLSKHHDINLADVAYTLNVGRKGFTFRGFLSGHNAAELADSLRKRNPIDWRQSQTDDKGKNIAFMFSGQGTQYANMGRGLYETQSVFRDTIDEGAQILKPLIGLDIRDILYPADGVEPDLKPSKIAQPALIVTEYALAKLCLSWGLEPAAMIGYSVGEYVAACLAGVFLLEDALQLITVRSQLMDDLSSGEMLSILLPKQEVETLISDDDDLFLAAHNAPELCVVSGSVAAINSFTEKLKNQRIMHVPLHTNNAAHSPLMAPIMAALREQISKMTLHPPQRPYLSNLTGTWITAAQATSVDYWCDQLLNTVLFSEGLQTLLDQEDFILLELGPEMSLTSFALQHHAQTHQTQRAVNAFNLLRTAVTEQTDEQWLLNSLGLMWLKGVKIDWVAFYATEKRLRIPLPSYPFERQRHWIEAPLTSPTTAHSPVSSHLKVKRPLDEWFYLPHWKRTSALALAPNTPALKIINYLCFSDKQGVGCELAQALQQQGAHVIEVRVGEDFSHNAEGYTLNPCRRDDYQSLFNALLKANALPQAVVHGWSLDCGEDFEQNQRLGFDSLLCLVQMWPSTQHDRHLVVLSNQLHTVTDMEALKPMAATLLGPVQTMGAEYPDLYCRNVDIVPPTNEAQKQVLLAQLLEECQFSTQERVVAYRNKYRWVRCIESTQFPAVDSEPVILRRHGVYLISSLNTLGLSLANYLAETVQAKLIFLIQSTSDKSTSDKSTSDKSTSDKSTSAESTAIPDIHLRGLQIAGAEVFVLQADLSCRAQMQTVIEQAHDRFGQIHGVIHAATSCQTEPITNQPVAEISPIIAAKVQGSLVLTELLDVHALDFIVFCSSLNAVMETSAQVDDCGANAFFDSYAAMLCHQGVNAISVNWDTWAATHANAVQADEAKVVFARILNYPVSQVLLSTVDWEQRIRDQSQQLETRAVDETEAALVGLNRATLTSDNKLSRHHRPALATEYVAAETDLEQQLVEMWQSLFGIEPIGIYDNFFELGGHSLLGLQFLSRLRDELALDIALERVFVNPVLKAIANGLEAQQQPDNQIPPITPMAEGEPIALSFAQQRMWFLAHLEGPSATYNLTDAFRMSGHLNIDALQQSLRWVLTRHTSLRTYFPTQDGQPQAQLLTMDAIDDLAIHDLSHLSPSIQSEEVKRLANEHSLHPFDLSQGPLFKVTLLLLAERETVMLLNTHHILSDGWSIGVFNRDWAHAYCAIVQGEQPDLPPLRIQYSDFSAWQRNWLQGDVLQQQLNYWQQQLAGIPQLLELPTDKPRPARQSYQGAQYTHSLPTSLTQAVTRLHQQQGVSLFMFLLSVTYVLLARYSRQDDICVGSPIANRNHHNETEDLIGLFVNTLVLRGQLQSRQSFTELLQETSKTCLAAYSHQDLPFDVLVEQLQNTRSLSYNPLIQFMLAIPSNLISELTLADITNTPLVTDYPIAKFDMTLYVIERNGQLHCLWEYATDLFERETIAQMAGHFESLLASIVANPNQAIAELSLLTTAEFQQLQTWSLPAPSMPLSTRATIVDLFEQQVALTPHNIAVIDDDKQLTYQQLNTQANQLAHHLLALMAQANIDTDNPLIAIAVESSADRVKGLLAVLKTGAAYVPIDPSYPAERVRYLLEDSAAPLLLTQSQFITQLALAELEHACDVVYLDETKLDSLPNTTAVNRSQRNDLAYVIYTSGSTGKPKGVMIEHHSLVNLSQWHNNAFAVQSTDKASLLANNAFDASVWELWPYLISGACVVPAPLERLVETGLWQWFNDQQITMSFLPTPVVEKYATESVPPTTHLRLLLTGGDKLHLSPDGLPCPLVNNYGPTENTVVTTSTRVTPSVHSMQTAPTIGKPINNVRVYILDEQNQPQPTGIPGELCIAGAGLARGYLNRPELTAEKFVEIAVLDKPQRIYKTGDLARWRSDGDLEYLGRIDQQVKLRGFRIELGEIETALNQHKAVKEAAVNLFEDDGNKRLVAYITPPHSLTENTNDTEVDNSISTLKDSVPTLKDWLRTQLPGYMIPSQFVVLDSLPLTANGKVDHKALPDPDSVGQTKTSEYLAPRSSTEQMLAQLWAEVLGLDRVSVHDNFFELGGHSLLAINIISRLHQTLDPAIEISVHVLFEASTVAELAQWIDLAAKWPAAETQSEENWEAFEI